MLLASAYISVENEVLLLPDEGRFFYFSNRELCRQPDLVKAVTFKGLHAIESGLFYQVVLPRGFPVCNLLLQDLKQPSGTYYAIDTYR